MQEKEDRGARVAGHSVMLAELASSVAFLGAILFGIESWTRPESASFATAAGVMMLASCVGFGLLVNAVLRK